MTSLTITHKKPLILNELFQNSDSNILALDLNDTILYQNPALIKTLKTIKKSFPELTLSTIFNKIKLNQSSQTLEFTSKKDSLSINIKIDYINSKELAVSKLIHLIPTLIEINNSSTNPSKIPSTKNKENPPKTISESDKHKIEFIATMSHELRTPLNAIIGFSEVLSENIFGQLNKKQSDYISEIWKGGKHMLSLINDILDITKIEYGNLKLLKEKTDLVSITRDSLKIIEENALKKQIMTSFNTNKPTITILIDPQRIRQVLYNLFSNALKFTPSNGKIEISIKDKKDNATISIKDTGIGINQKDFDEIFEKFNQIDSKSNEQGSGLGLSLCKKLIEIHNGSISVSSNGIDKGTTFIIVLPKT